MTEKQKRKALELPPMTRAMQAFAMITFFVFGLATAGFVFLNPFDLGFLPDRARETAKMERPPEGPEHRRRQ